MSSQPRKYLYSLDQWPPPLSTLIFALQWLMVLAPGVVVMGEIISAAQGFNDAQRLEFLQGMFVICGLTQIVQVLWGHRLPGLVGPAGVLMVGILGTLGSGLDAVYWSITLAAGLVMLLGLLGQAGRLSRLFTPPVLAATLLLLALCLIPATLPSLFYAYTLGGPEGSFCYAVLLALAMYAAEPRFKGIWSAAVVLLAMVTGSLVYHLAGLGPAPGPMPHIGPWFSLPWPDPGPPVFNPGLILAFILCYLAIISNELGADEALGHMIGVNGMEKRLNRAVLFTGAGGILGGLMSVPGPVTYATGPAMLISTKSASRFTLLPAGIMVLLLGLFPRGLSLFTLMPQPVVGGVLLYLLALSVIAGLELLYGPGRETDQRSTVVLSFAIMVGTVVTFMPEEAIDALPRMLRPILANGFVAGLITALLLEHLILKKRS